MSSISKKIRERLQTGNIPFFANDNISDFITKDELAELHIELKDKINDVLDVLLIDRVNDHNTKETANRVAKMYLNEVFKGRYHNQPKVTDFPNAKKLDQIYTVEENSQATLKDKLYFRYASCDYL